MKEVIEKIKGMNNYYAGDYKIIKNYLTGRYICTDNEVFKNELLLLQNKLINKKISDIDILNKYYSTYIRSKIIFDNLGTLEEKQNHMEMGQIIYYTDKVLKGNNFDWIEIDKNIVKKGNIYYLKDTEIKVFEDVEVDNQGKYYYCCDKGIALDINNIQKIFSNEIMNLDYLAQGHYNDNKIFFFNTKQEGKYNFKVNLDQYNVYKRIYFVNVGFKEIYYIKENEIDIDDTVDVDEKINNLALYSFIKNRLIDLKNQSLFLNNYLNNYEEKFKKFKDYEIDLVTHLNTLKDIKKEYHNDYIIIQNFERYHKIYLDNRYSRYFHGTSMEGAKNIVTNGFMTNKNLVEFNFNKLFFSQDIYVAKAYGVIGGIDTYLHANTKCIIFECNLDSVEDRLYHYYHTVEHFIYDNKPISPDVIKRIWLVENDVILKEITKEELLKMEV